jgi:hypothetical protein
MRRELVGRPPAEGDRRRRANRLRTDWRKADDAAHASDASADEDADRRRREDALESNDRLREEAPADLETRRRADQLEREIKGSRQADES